MDGLGRCSHGVALFGITGMKTVNSSSLYATLPLDSSIGTYSMQLFCALHTSIQSTSHMMQGYTSSHNGAVRQRMQMLQPICHRLSSVGQPVSVIARRISRRLSLRCAGVTCCCFIPSNKLLPVGTLVVDRMIRFLSISMHDASYVLWHSSYCLSSCDSCEMPKA